MRQTVHSFRQSMLKRYGEVDEEKVKEYAIKRANWKRDLRRQRGVLDRMRKRGCRACEMRRQQEWVKKLESEQ